MTDFVVQGHMYTKQNGAMTLSSSFANEGTNTQNTDRSRNSHWKEK